MARDPGSADLTDVLRLVRVARARVERIAVRNDGEAALWAGWAMADLDAALKATPDIAREIERRLGLLVRRRRGTTDWIEAEQVVGVVRDVLTPAPRPSPAPGLRQTIYDALPRDAGDELYELADRIHDAVAARLAAAADAATDEAER